MIDTHYSLDNNYQIGFDGVKKEGARTLIYKNIDEPETIVYVLFDKSDVDKDRDYDKLEKLIIENCNFKSLKIDNSVATKVKIQILNCNIIENITCKKNTTFCKTLLIANNNYKIDFNNIIFKNDLILSLDNDKNDIKLENCKFPNEKSVLELNSPGELQIRLNNSKFNCKVRIQNCDKINSLQCNNTTFNNLIDFYNSTFLNKTSFYQTDFLSKTIFSNVTFLKNVMFRYNKVNSDTYINFSKTTFREGINIAESNFVNNLNFWGIDYTTYVPDDDEEKKEIQESLRIIKDSFRQKNDSISALKYEKFEIDIFRKTKLKPVDVIQLLLNDMSNKQRTDWTRGVLFTLLIATITYLTAIWLEIWFTPLIDKVLYQHYHKLSLGQQFNYFIKEFISIINITNWTNVKILGHSPCGGSLFIVYIGRIFIAYGYYQTIQAFRKYSKV